MARSILRLAVVCLLFSFGESPGHSQEAVRPKASQPDDPFQHRLDEFRSKRLDQLGAPSQRRMEISGEQSVPPLRPGEVKRASDGSRIVAALTEAAKDMLKEDAADDKLRLLMKERCKTALQEVEARLHGYRSGRSAVKEVLEACGRLATAVLALNPDDATRIALLKQSVELSKEIETFATLNMQNGIGTLQDTMQAKYERLSAEIKLEEAKAEIGKVNPNTLR